ncbi:hypothetical protein PRNP1_003442 [Phytophthora ramorum]
MVVPDQLRPIGANQMSDKSSTRFLRSGTVEEERAWDINKLDDILNNLDVRNAKFEKWVGKKYKYMGVESTVLILMVDAEELAVGLHVTAPEDAEYAIEEIKAYGAPVRDFRLRLGPYEPSQGPYDPRHFELRPTILGDVEDLDINWSTMFESMPGLKRLDLTMVSILIVALEKWYVGGSCGGLRQLSVLSCDEADNASRSTQLVEAVIRFCPRIEYVNGFQQALDPDAEDCSDMWSISLETWQAFNASCTSLRAFSWTLVPFGDMFFQVFGEHRKPQLEALSLTANVSWKYEHYLREFPGSIVRVDEFDLTQDMVYQRVTSVPPLGGVQH